jgi:hypothetical protein
MTDIIKEIAEDFVPMKPAPGEYGEGKTHRTPEEIREIVEHRRDTIMQDAPPPRAPVGIDPYAYTALELAIQTNTANGRVVSADVLVQEAEKIEAFLRKPRGVKAAA